MDGIVSNNYLNIIKKNDQNLYGDMANINAYVKCL